MADDVSGPDNIRGDPAADDVLNVLFELKYISISGSSLLRGLISLVTLSGGYQVEQVVARLQGPSSGATEIFRLAGIKKFGVPRTSFGKDLAKFSHLPVIERIAVEVDSVVSVVDFLAKMGVPLIDSKGAAREWLEVTQRSINFLEYYLKLIAKLVNALNEARSEIEHSSGDSWVDRLNIDPASEATRALLVSNEQLKEYFRIRDGDDEISVSIYLDTDDKAVQRDVVQHVRQLVDLLGYKEGDNPNVQGGSIFRRSWARLKSGLTSTEVRQRLVKVERALEIALIDERQADTDSKEAQAVEQLLCSLESVTQACMRVGSILLIKYQGSQGSIVLVRNLSQLEIRALEQFPEIQQNPQKVLQSLSLAMSQLDQRTALEPDG